MQAGSFAPPVQPQQKKGPRRGLIIGILSLLVLLILIGSGIFFFTRSRGTTSTQTSAPTVVHLQITPYTYKGHTNALNTVAWSPDGKSIASGGYDKTVQVWNATTGALLVTYKGHSETVEALAWSPDGKRIASGGGSAFGGGDTTVQVWDPTNGGNVFTYRGHTTKGVNAIAWSPDSRYIVSGSDDKTVQVWQPK